MHSDLFDNLPEVIDDLEPIRLGESPRLVDLLGVRRSLQAQRAGRTVRLEVTLVEQDKAMVLAPHEGRIGWVVEDFDAKDAPLTKPMVEDIRSRTPEEEDNAETIGLAEALRDSADDEDGIDEDADSEQRRLVASQDLDEGTARLALDTGLLLDYTVGSNVSVTDSTQASCTLHLELMEGDLLVHELKVVLTLLPARIPMQAVQILASGLDEEAVLSYPAGYRPLAALALEVNLGSGEWNPKRRFVAPREVRLTVLARDETSGEAIDSGIVPVVGMATNAQEAPEAVPLILDPRLGPQRFRVYLLTGNGEQRLAEPPVAHPAAISLMPRLEARNGEPLLGLAQIEFRVRVRAQTGPRILRIDYRVDAGPIVIDLERSEEWPQEKIQKLADMVWYAGRPGHGSRMDISSSRLSLEGHLGEQPVRFLASYEIDSDNSRAARLFKTKVHALGVSLAGDGAYSLGSTARTADIRLDARLAGGDAQSMIGTTADFKLTIVVRVGDTPAARVCFIRSVRVDASAPPHYLAIDLGTSAISAAFAAEGGPSVMLDLGSVLSVYDNDHDEAGSYFISSMAGIDTTAMWRHQQAAVSLWGVAGEVTNDIEHLLETLSRTYPLGLPPIPANAFATAGSTVLGSKMHLMSHNGRLMPRRVETGISHGSTSRREGEGIDIIALTADILHELAHFYVPWSVDVQEVTGAQLVLTHPNLYSQTHRERLKQAATKACDWLGCDLNAVRLIRESDAAAYHFLYAAQERLVGSAHVLAFDLGAGTLDITLTRVDPAMAGARLLRLRHDRRLGAGVGGDAIDFVLFFIIDAALRRLPPDSSLLYRHRLVEHTRKSNPEQRENHLAAKRNLARAIRSAKHDLSTRCRDRCSEEIFRWPEDEPFRVQVGVTGGDEEERARWPVTAVAAKPLTAPLNVAGGVRLEADAAIGELFLVLSKRAVEREAMTRLMRFMTEKIVELALPRQASDLGDDPARYLLVSGRASLWPLVYEGLQQTMANRDPRRELLSAHPPASNELKEAVVRGAISMARSAESDSRIDDQLDLGVLYEDLDRSTHAIYDWQPLHGESGRIPAEHHMRIMWAPRGLPRELLTDWAPWGRTLLIETGHDEDAKYFNPPPPLESVEWRRNTSVQPLGHGWLTIGDRDFPRGQGKPQPSPALYALGYDVGEEDRPENLGAVEPEPLEFGDAAAPESDNGISSGGMG